MYRVGLIDDDSDAYKDYKKRLGRKEIELIYLAEWSELDEIIDWILANSIECLIVDHKLTAKYSFYGTEVVSYINSHFPDLPCLILTNYPEDSRDDNLVVENLIFDRNIMSGDDITEICDIIKQAVMVYRNRLDNHLVEYKILLSKKENNSISADQEEEFLHLYKLLKAYGEVDEISTALLKTGVHQKVDSLIEKLDYFLEKNEE